MLNKNLPCPQLHDKNNNALQRSYKEICMHVNAPPCFIKLHPLLVMPQAGIVKK